MSKYRKSLKLVTIVFLILSNLFTGFPIDFLLKNLNLGFTTVITPAQALTTTYDFSTCAGGNTCDSSTDWWASADDVDLFPFANDATNANTHTEAVDANYTALASSNDSRYASANPGTGDFILNYFEMDIAEDPADISSITFTYEGATTSTANFAIYVKDDTTTGENDIAWLRVGTVQSITANTETTFSRTLTGINFADYIGSTGQIVWAVSESVAAVVVSTDYVKLDVVTNTVEQEGFRWRNDDGSETTATWLAAQDTNVTQPSATNTRLRTILNDTSAGNQATTQYQLEYKLSTDTSYRPVQASSGSLAFGSAGTASANQTTILQITAPATVNRGDLLVMGIANKYPSNGPTTPTGWTAITNYQASGGIGTTGLDTGLIYSTVFIREAEGWEDDVVFSVNVPSANGSEGQIIRYTKGNGKEWDLAATTASDNTGSSNSWSAAGAGNPGITAGDMVVVVSAVNTDLYNYSAEAITATGLTMGTQTERVESASTGGDDMELVMSDHVVSSGTASTAPTFTMTSSSNSATAPGGASVIMRIRQVDAPIQLSASANITASGQNTTAQLTSPSGSPTFITGRMQDDENPADTIDINDSQYTELEWSMIATSNAADTEVYQFRVTANGDVLSDYTVTPQWTIGTPGSPDDQQIHYRWRNDDGGEAGSGGTLNLQVGAIGDDGDTDISADTQNSTTRSTIPLGSFNGTSHMGVARFNTVTIPQGATITSATFIATGQISYNCAGCTVASLVYLEDADNSAALSTTNMNDKVLTTANTSWNQNTVVVDTEYNVDVTSAVQEVIDRGGWSSGNSMSVIMRNNGSTASEWQDYYTYDNTPAKAPKLQITYTSGGSGATWAAAEDTLLADVVKGTQYRLRMEISNEGTSSDGGRTHQLQVAETGTCSSGTYSAVPTDTSGDWQIVTSTHFVDGAATSNIASGLTDEEATFVAGELKDTSNTTGSITLAADRFTEIEFSIEPTTNATDGGNYCFRLTNTDTYTIYAQATILSGLDIQQLHYRWRNDDGDEGAPASSWYDTDWGYRQSIVIDDVDVIGSSNLTNFPALISFTDADLKDTGNSGHVGQSDGGDIVFTNSSGTKLDHEIEKYTASTGEVIAWVEIDTLSYNVDTTIYVYYGNAAVADQENPTGVWDSNYKMVQHLEEGTTGATSVLDSTSNANDSDGVTITGAGSSATATGKIGNAYQFDGTDDIIYFGDSASLDQASSYTVELWYYPESLPSVGTLEAMLGKTGAATDETAGSETNYSLIESNGLVAAGNYETSAFEDSSQVDYAVSQSFTPTTSTWYHLTGVFDDTSNTLTLYRNGAQVAQATGITGTPATNSTDLYLGHDSATSSPISGFFDGIIDEVRLSSGVRSADWLATEYNNQSDPSTSGWLTSIGSEETVPSGASWAEAEDTTLADVPKTTSYRLRIELSNEGSTTDGGATHQLEVAETGTCSSGTYAAVPTDTSGDWQVVASTHITDGAATTNFGGSLTDGEVTFVAGQVKDTGNTTSSITLAADTFTEIEYSIQATSNATSGGTYCFRLTNANTYTVYAQATIVASASTFTQNYYRWYVDNNSTNPTDAWGNPDLAENAILAPLPNTNDPPNAAQELRLRINVTVATSNMSAGSQQFKIQFKAGTDGSCTTGSWTDVGSAQTWEFASSGVTDGTTITSVLSNSDVAGQYAKSNPTAVNANAANTGQDIEYDFHIIGTNMTAAKRYSFRMVESDGSVFTAYTNCPTLITEPATDNFMRHGNFYSDEVEQGFFW